MNNLIYSTLLILVKALHLADADCAIPDIANAYLNRDDQCKDITITCQKGYRMQSVLSCSKGLWIFEEPVCEPDFTDQCLDEPEIINGILDNAITSRNVGDIYGFKCDPPFVTNGNRGRVTCTETGKWETNITCEGQCLGEPEIINGNLDGETTSMNFGDTYGFHCDPYFIKGEPKGTVTCTETGEWEANITCEDCFVRIGISSYCSPFFVATKGLCNAKCTETCTTVDYLTEPDSDGFNCYICGLPLLEDIGQVSLADCIQSCKDLPDCLTLNHYGTSCKLFSVTLQALKASPNFVVKSFGDSSDVIAEKNTCPSVL